MTDFIDSIIGPAHVEDVRTERPLNDFLYVFLLLVIRLTRGEQLHIQHIHFQRVQMHRFSKMLD
jgi:hypothetical protein